MTPRRLSGLTCAKCTWCTRYTALGAALGMALASALPVRAQTEPAPNPPAHSAAPSPQERGDAAFQRVDAVLATQLTDVQSAVVLLRGRTVYSYYRDGNADALRDTQSAAKSAMSALVGAALAQGHIASADQRVVELVPEWAPLNSDPRAATITLRHLLTLTAGFVQEDSARTRAGTAAALPVRQAWARPLGSEPGQTFAYDNSVVPLLTAVLEKATGMPLPEYARQQLVGPLQMAEPGYDRGRLALRTQDMAKLGQLYLQRGLWEGRQLLPAAFVDDSVRVHNAGGPPVRLPYGYLWWVIPSQASPSQPPLFMASGWGGQFIWVHPAMELVIATTATASAQSASRGHALQLIRQHLFAAAQRAF